MAIPDYSQVGFNFNGGNGVAAPGPQANQQGGQGFDWNSLLGGVGAAAGAYGAYTNGQNQNAGLASIMRGSSLTPTNLSNAGGTANAAPGNMQSNVDPRLQQAFGGGANLSNQALGQAQQFNSGGLPQNVQDANSQYGQVMQGQNNNFNQMAQQGLGIYNNGVSPNAYAAQNNQLQQAQSSFGDVYNGSLNNIMGALKPQQDQQAASLSDQQFGRGQMGSSGGALQTKAMYQGFGQADLAAQQQAYGQALQQQQQNVNAATAYGNMGNQNLLTGTNLLNSAFQQFGMNSQNLSNQGQLSSLPGQLAQQQANLANTGFGVSQGVNQLGLNNLQMAQNGGIANSQLANNAGANYVKGAQAQTNQGGNVAGGIANMLTSGGANSLANQGIGALSKLFGLGGSDNGGPSAGSINAGNNSTIDQMLGNVDWGSIMNDPNVYGQVDQNMATDPNTGNIDASNLDLNSLFGGGGNPP